MPKIKIYSTTTCVYCKALKAYLKSKDVTYEEVLLDMQPEAVQASIDTCGSMGVPCTHITLDDGTEEKILGFDKAKFDTVLGLA
jgi:glutaredoxin 3